MKFIRFFVYSSLVLGALASQCSDVIKFNKKIKGAMEATCNSDGKITELYLDGINMDEDVIKFISDFSEIEILNVFQGNFPNNLDYSSFRNFKKLEEAIIQYESDALHIVKNIKSIKKINLFRIDALYQKELDTLATLTNLKEFDMIHTYFSFTTKFDYSSMKNLKNLERLYISGPSSLGPFKEIKSLKELEIIGNTYVDDEDFKIISGFSELKSLIIDVRDIYATDFSPLKKLKKLSELEIKDGCDKVPEELKSLCTPKVTTTKKSSTKKSTTKTTTKTTKSTKSSTPTYNKEGKCGSKYGKCKPGYCCSRYGYCGKDSEYCNSGCQSSFGRCN